jgi:site-specific recombinase XerD
MKWEYFFDLYLEKYCVARGLAPKTIVTYRDVLEEFKKYVETRNGLAPDEVTSTLVCEYIDYLKRSRLNGLATQNKKFVVVKSFYRALVALEQIAPKQDPCVRLPPMKRPQEKAGDILSAREIEQLAGAPNRETLLGLRDRAILLLLCTTGIRASECAGIRQCDVDMENRMVRVLGKGNRERVVMLNETTLKALENYEKFRGSQSRDQPFFKVRTGKGIDRKRIFERVKYYLRRARIFKKISPHRLRHSFATKMIKDGVGVATLKELLGHRNLQSTMRYITICGEDLRSAIAKLRIDDTFEKMVSMLPVGRLRYQRPLKPDSS